MEVHFLNIFLRLSGMVFRLKNRLVKAHGWRILPIAVTLVLAELIFILVSLPLFFLVSPKSVQERGLIFPASEKRQWQGYMIRRKVTMITAVGAGSVWAFKILVVGIISFYLFGTQALLADTQDYTFDNSADYTFDSGKIEVAGGVAQLKDNGSSASGSTTNPGFDVNTTGWTYSDWDQGGGEVNVNGVRVPTGGNPGGWININFPSGKSDALGGYWYQAFTTTVTDPTVTVNFDYQISAHDNTPPPITFKLYVSTDTGSTPPAVGQEIWTSGEITNTQGWTAISNIDASARISAPGTYYFKLGAWIQTPSTNSGPFTVGFDNAQLNWNKTTHVFASDKPTIAPNTSLTAAKVITWDSFTETATKNGGEIYYQLSDDNGSIWKFWNGSDWVAAGANDYNLASDVSSHISSFPTVSNQIKWRAFLSGDGTQQVILDNVAIGYTQNSLPVIADLMPAQNETAGFVYVNYGLQDNNSDPASLTAYEYSLTGAFAGEQVTMAPALGDPSHDGVSGLASSPGGVAHTFVWDAVSQLGAIYDGTVYVRLRPNDGIGDGAFTTSAAFPVDYVVPVIANVSVVQNSGTTDVAITYDLSDDIAANSTVELDISEDGGATWTVPDVSVTGDVGAGVATGIGNVIIWNAKDDFDGQLQDDLQVRIRARDAWQNQGIDVMSSNFSLDTLAPATLIVANLQAQPNAGDSTVLIGGSFTESNPNTNDFYVAINGGSYFDATAGTGDTASPADQHTFVGATLDGNDYVSLVLIAHTDDFGQLTDNENTTPSVSYRYVRPYTPSAPTLSSPATTNLNLTINPHALEAADLQYVIFETTTGQFVQSDGTLGEMPSWRLAGTVNVNGLSSPLANYIFQVKSRNPSDTGHAASSESAYSATAQITNTVPTITFDSVAQTVDGSQQVNVNYAGTDGQGDVSSLPVYEYSADNLNWFTMTEKSDVGSEGTSNLIFLSAGSAHSFVWNSAADLPNSEHASVRVRLRANDSLSDGGLATSSPFEIDQKAPIVSNVSATQNSGDTAVTITYDLSDANSSQVELDISEDGGLTWSVTDVTVSGDVGPGITPGVAKTIVWDADADFNNQYQNDLQIRVRARDAFGNQGEHASSSNFALDTHDPIISNVTATQDNAAKTFTFHYDVSEDAGNVQVGLEISSNSGSTWIVPATTLSGDLGAGLVSGIGKTVTWNAGVDYDGYEKAGMQIRVTVSDVFTNTAQATSSDFSLDTLAPRVTGVGATETLGATDVAIGYTLADQNSSLVEIDISEDGGLSWTVTDTSASGDVGPGIAAGIKTINWPAGTDFDEQLQSDLRIRIRAKDIFENQSSNTESSNFNLDTVNPLVDVVVDLQAQPSAGDTTVLLGGSFTELNPNTNDFYLGLASADYGAPTIGQSNTATPANQATEVGLALTGNDYLAKVKITHTDDYGQTVVNENLSPNLSYRFVKPYTPAAPTVDDPTVGTVDVTINPHAGEAIGLEYAILETTQNKYVQTDGILGDSIVWQTDDVWGTVTVRGLVNDSYAYQFKTVSRNPNDSAHAPSSESAYSGGASSTNQSPVIDLGLIGQTTDGSNYVTINYIGSDLESENSNLVTAEYSMDGSNWFEMTEKTGVGSDGLTNLVFLVTGTSHFFMWDVASDRPNTEDATVYVRLQADDGTSSGAIVTSDAFTVDIKNPVTSLVTAEQLSTGQVEISYTLTDISSSTVEIDISEDAGATWTVTDVSTSGDVGPGVLPGTNQVIIWDAPSDFAGQAQSDLRVRVRASDAFGNIGTNTSSPNFSVDTQSPVVSNVTASQDSGLNTVTIGYDLADVNDSTIVVEISEDNGATWGVATSTLSGDVGTDVTPGNGKTISWNAAVDFPNREQGEMMVRVQATDNFANVSGAVSSSAFSVDTKAPVISNVRATQSLGTDSVSIIYDLSDSGLSEIAIDLSDDGGATWTISDTSTIGSIGAGISAGLNKTIIWDANADAPLLDVATARVRVRGTDPFQNSSVNIESGDFTVDTRSPSVDTVTDLIVQPLAGQTTALLGGSFIESNPGTNDFYLSLAGDDYAVSTVGDSNTAGPSDQLTAVGTVLNGSDVIAKVKIVHTDDYNHNVTNENLAPDATLKYIKPYTPPAPIVNRPQNTSVDLTAVAHDSEAPDLAYTIYEVTTDRYVQASGSLGLSPVWQTLPTWGTVTVTGLSSPVANYQFRTMSRNSGDLAHQTGSQSDLSLVGSIENTAPSITVTSASQLTDQNLALVDYQVDDTEFDATSLIAYEFSTDNLNWQTMTEDPGVSSEGTFAWDLSVDLPNFEDSTVYVRLQVTDSLQASNIATSSAFPVDTLGPVISNITVSQTPGSGLVNIGYDLADITGSNNTVNVAISSDGGVTWIVPTSTLTGDVDGGVSTGDDRLITWDAGTDFANQESSTMQVRIQATDAFSNIGDSLSSSNFAVDTKGAEAANVTAIQNAGSGDVTVTYSLNDGSIAGLTTEFEVSDDAGLTWDVVNDHASGEIGAGQTVGDKTFIWQAGVDFADQYQTDLRIRVRARDYFGNLGVFSSTLNFTIDTAPAVISNLDAAQTSGTDLVVVNYDLYDDTNSDLEVRLDISSDSGLTWNVIDASVTGQVGSGINAGVNQEIVWDAGADFASRDLSSMRVRLIAVDHFNNVSSPFDSEDFALDTATPQGLADLSLFTSTDDSALLTWTPATDTNFDHYEIRYGTNQSDVVNRTGSAERWSAINDSSLTNSLTSSTTITGLDFSADLYAKIWAIDDFGHETTVEEINLSAISIVEVSRGGVSSLPDTTAPVVPILNRLLSPINEPSVVITGLAEPLSQIDLYDGEQILHRFGQPTSYRGRFSQRFTFTEGAHRLSVRAIDSAGNISAPSAVVDLIIDLTAPDLPVVNNSQGIEITETTPIIIGGSEPLTNIEISIDGELVAMVASDNIGNWRYLVPAIRALSLGEHRITVRAIDLAGNVSEPAHWGFVLVAQLAGVPSQTLGLVPIIPGLLPPTPTPSFILPLPAPPVPLAEIIREEAAATELESLPVPEVRYTAAFADGERFAFSGTAQPDSNVVVYIHSEQALIYRAQADVAGVWSVVHSQETTELSPGEHTIYAVSIDSEARVKSSSGPTMSFTVTKNLWVTLYNYLNLQTTIITLLVLGLCGFWLYRLRVKKGVKI